jgi:hypothetical protein
LTRPRSIEQNIERWFETRTTVPRGPIACANARRRGAWRSCVRAGELVECDPKLVTRAILGAIDWTARWYRPDGPQPVRLVAGGLAD